MHKTIRKARLHGGSGGYRNITDEGMTKARARGFLFLTDGVDGDEKANTVTYYYTRCTPAEAEEMDRWTA